MNRRDALAEQAPLAVIGDTRFQEIPREKVSDRVALELLRLISSGRLAPGERLPGERQLADMMNVSRVSVRAALQQLKAQGLVAAVQGGGTRVVAASSEVNPSLVSLARGNLRNQPELMEIRSRLEVWAARRAAKNATPEQIEEIQQHLTAMSLKGRKPRDTADDDMKFHLAIAKAANSPMYLHLLSALGDALERSFTFTRMTLWPSSQDLTLLEQHHRIAVAIRMGDPDAAEQAMEDHLEHVRIEVKASLQAKGDSQAPP